MPSQPVAPAAPASYTAPAPTSGSMVTSFSELQTEFAFSTPRVIVIADGTYTGGGTTYLATNDGHQVWAETQGGVTLDFGLTFGGNSGTPGGEVHGINFDVSDPLKVDPVGLLNDAIITTWGPVGGTYPGNNLVVEDCTFDGNSLIGSGIQNLSPDGFQARRCTFDNFLDAGISAFRNGTAGDALTVPVVIEDCVFNNISRAVPGSGSGASAEIAILIGHQAIIRRVRIRNCAWAGIGVLNDAQDWVVQDYDIDYVGHGYFDPGGVAIYCEQSHSGFIYRGLIGTHTKVGVNCEWNSDNLDPYLNSLIPRNYAISIVDATIQSYKVGVHFDISVAHCSVRDVRFERSWKAGVLDNNQFPDSNGDYQPGPGQDPIFSTNAVDLSTCEFFMDSRVPRFAHDHHGGVSATPPYLGWPTDPDDYDDSGQIVVEYGSINTPAPVVSNELPAQGATLTSSTRLQFDYVDPNSITYSVYVVVEYPDKTVEVVHNGTSFTPLYEALSSREDITNGYRFSIRRSGNWPNKPKLILYP